MYGVLGRCLDILRDKRQAKIKHCETTSQWDCCGCFGASTFKEIWLFIVNSYGFSLIEWTYVPWSSYTVHALWPSRNTWCGHQDGKQFLGCFGLLFLWRTPWDTGLEDVFCVVGKKQRHHQTPPFTNIIEITMGHLWNGQPPQCVSTQNAIRVLCVETTMCNMFVGQNTENFIRNHTGNQPCTNHLQF